MEWFARLKMGLTLTSVKGDIRQPHNEAMGNIAQGYSRWHTASNYLYDIERILLEIKMTQSFIDKPPTDDFLVNHEINPEDYIMYHQGYFLDLVHQLKDKICQMINAIANPQQDYSRKNENNVKLSKLLKNDRIKRIPDLVAALAEWDDTGPVKPISLVLKKRTNYHHFKNPLTATESYFQAKNMRTLLAPDMQINLSEYGKQMITERREKSLETWHADSSDKMQKTSDAVNANLDAISKALVKYFKFPRSTDRTARKILAQYVPMLESLKTTPNSRTLEDMDPHFAAMFINLGELLTEGLGEDFVSLYVTGSLVRGEFNMGLSDVNLVIIMRDESPLPKEGVQAAIDVAPRRFGIPTDTQIFLRSEFMAEDNERIRFICKSDGLLIYGANLLKYGHLPNKSYKLVWLLNSDFKDKLAEHRRWIESQDLILPSRHSAMVARDLAKRAYRMAFGQVIGNHTVYASSFRDMRRLFLEYTPENRDFIEMTYGIIRKYPSVDKEGLLAMVDEYEKNLLPLYDKVNEVVNGVKQAAATQ